MRSDWVGAPLCRLYSLDLCALSGQESLGRYVGVRKATGTVVRDAVADRITRPETIRGHRKRVVSTLTEFARHSNPLRL